MLGASKHSTCLTVIMELSRRFFPEYFIHQTQASSIQAVLAVFCLRLAVWFRKGLHSVFLSPSSETSFARNEPKRRSKSQIQEVDQHLPLGLWQRLPVCTM